MLWNVPFTCMGLPEFPTDRRYAYNDRYRGKWIFFTSFVSLRK